VTEGPVDLTAFAPAVCPHNHVLRYGGRKDAKFLPNRVLVGWTPCSCPGARERKPPSHHWVECQQCAAEGRPDAMVYGPPHIPG
jgi:hypothetical protein